VRFASLPRQTARSLFAKPNTQGGEPPLAFGRGPRGLGLLARTFRRIMNRTGVRYLKTRRPDPIHAPQTGQCLSYRGPSRRPTAQPRLQPRPTHRGPE